MFSFKLYQHLYIRSILIFTMWNSAVRQKLATHWTRRKQFHNLFYWFAYLVFYYMDWFTNYLGICNSRKKKRDSCFTVYLKFLLNKDAQYCTKRLCGTVRITCKGNIPIPKKLILRKQWEPAAPLVWGAGCQEDTSAGRAHSDSHHPSGPEHRGQS